MQRRGQVGVAMGLDQPPAVSARRRRRNTDTANRHSLAAWEKTAVAGRDEEYRADRAEAARVFTQILDKLQDLQERMATKDDLEQTKEEMRRAVGSLLPREVYDAYHQQDVAAAQLNSQRIAALDDRYDRLESEFHTFEVSDARQIGQVRSSAERGIAQAVSGIDQRTIQMLFQLALLVAAAAVGHFIH